MTPTTISLNRRGSGDGTKSARAPITRLVTSTRTPSLFSGMKRAGRPIASPIEPAPVAKLYLYRTQSGLRFCWRAPKKYLPPANGAQQTVPGTYAAWCCGCGSNLPSPPGTAATHCTPARRRASPPPPGSRRPSVWEVCRVWEVAGFVVFGRLTRFAILEVVASQLARASGLSAPGSPLYEICRPHQLTRRDSVEGRFCGQSRVPFQLRTISTVEIVVNSS